MAPTMPLPRARHAMRLLAAAEVVGLVCMVEPPVEASAGLESGFAGGVIPPGEVDAAWTAAQD